MPTISLAIASFHKDTYLVRSLKSVYSWVDEIILVYGSEKDDLIEDVKKLDTDKKVRIHFTDNPPMFHINKQKAIKRCTKDWIFQLDGDEVVTPELRKEILETLENHTDNDPVGYWIPRLNYFLGKPLRKGGQYPDPTIRLYKNSKAYLECKTVHEQAKVEGAVGHLHNDLLHYPYPTFRDFVYKWSKYGALESETASAHLKPSMWNFIMYMIIKPKLWFLKTYFRHKGFVDGFPGFIFSLFSALRYWLEYIRAYERHHLAETRSKS